VCEKHAGVAGFVASSLPPELASHVRSRSVREYERIASALEKTDIVELATREVRLKNGKAVLRLGTPQNTGGQFGAQHAETVLNLANGQLDDATSEYIVMNRSLKTITGRTDLGSQGSKLPDVGIVRRDGAVDLIEVQSPNSQTVPELMDKLKAMRLALPEQNRGTVFVYTLDGTGPVAHFP